MGRHKSFEETAALDGAIRLFWQQGYEASSVRELCAEMDLGGASFYNAFGDKQKLFRLALQRYLDTSAQNWLDALESAQNPVSGLRDFLARLVQTSIKERRGCMLVNAAVEFGPDDGELGKAVRLELQRVENGLRRAIERGHDQGRLLDFNPVSLSRQIMGTMVAIRVLSRTTNNAELLWDIARPTLKLLGDTGRHS